MQQQQVKMEMKKRMKVCSVRSCTQQYTRMFTFPQEKKDKKRMMQWVEACDHPNLLILPPEKLKFWVICSSHIEEKYFMRKRLTTSAVPTLYLLVSEAASIKIKQQETLMEIPEEEEECKPDCTGGMDTKCGIVGHVDFTALPGPSGEMQCNDLGRLSLQEDKPLHNADCVVLGREHQRSEAQKGHKGNILKMLKDNIVEKPLQQRIYSAVAAVWKAARQCKRRQMATKDRIKKIEHLVQVGVCQVLENLPTRDDFRLDAQRGKTHLWTTLHGRGKGISFKYL
ncbi:uncharacterized protein LOC143306881 isoform X1 [Osmia lignaria lignaria]